MTWHVELEGTPGDIDALRLYAEAAGYEIITSMPDGLSYLTGEELDRLEEYQEVKDIAEDLVPILNGLARLDRPRHGEIKPTGSLRRLYDDDRVDTVVTPKSQTLHLSMGAVLVREGESGDLAAPPDPRIELTRTALNDPFARNVLILLSSEPTPARLRSAYELMAVEVSGQSRPNKAAYKALIDGGYVTQEENDDFNATMHDARLSGPDALHQYDFKSHLAGRKSAPNRQLR